MHTPAIPIQLFDAASSTYTYLLIDPHTRDAILIDPVDDQLARDLAVLKEHAVRLRYVVETHAHADHITSAAALIEHTGAQTATPEGCGIKPSAIQLKDGDVLSFGTQTFTALHTPGHTAGSMSFVWGAHVFTGDTLLIGGCGRTDFQSGSAQALHHSITQILLKLPDTTTVWPGHDYKGQTSSTIGREKTSNARITDNGQLRSVESFVQLMNNLNLPKPQRIDEAVPANLTLGARHDAGAPANMQPLPKADAGYAGDVSVQLAYQWWKSGEAVLIDIRSNAERAWVGFVPDAPVVEWKIWPGMQINPDFDAQLQALVPAGSKIVMLCRSGLRSIASSQRATTLGYQAYNILEGFEGDPDASAHRGTKGGWRFHGLPWRQN
jgi:glyoxylase-like metal-dependent hydrolase (beta-lactamase superfamily II)/rhodanese-related sulfurtransferase